MHENMKATCEHCGGAVDEHGYAMDLQSDDNVEEQTETGQEVAAERLHDGAFADAVKRKRGG